MSCLRFSNPRVQISCCCTSFFFIIALFYLVPGIIDYERYEKNVETSCTINSWDTKTRDCSLTQCSNGGTSCVTIRTICYTCRYNVVLTTIENIPLIATTDYDGDFATVGEARSYCASRTLQSPLPCFYQPSQPRANRFYVTLTAPTTNTYLAPIILFSVLCILTCAFTGYSQCKTAPSDIGLERIYTLARERAIDANMRALRWSDYYTDEPDPFMDPQRNLTGNARIRSNGTLNGNVIRTSGHHQVSPPPSSSSASLNLNINHPYIGNTNNYHPDTDSDIVLAANPMHPRSRR